VNKSQLIEQVAARTDMRKSEAAGAVEADLQTIEDNLSRGAEIAITGFGKFHVAERGARQGRNPRTGERIDIAAAKVPRFSAGAGLKQAVNRPSW
jgi:DNA-binding protein HU-beta